MKTNNYPKECSNNNNKPFHNFHYWDESGLWHCGCGAEHGPAFSLRQADNPPADQRVQEFKWINVKDYLPEKTERVLVLTISGGMQTVKTMEYNVDKGFITRSVITHWAHIPEIPGDI